MLVNSLVNCLNGPIKACATTNLVQIIKSVSMKPNDIMTAATN